MKRTWPILLVLLLLAASTMRAQFSYVTNADNATITITGYHQPFGAVIIPAIITGLPVTGVGSHAFMQDYNLNSITIPGSVTNIADFAFFECVGLTNAVFSSGVTSIGDCAFQVTGLFSATIPGCVTNIGYEAFEYCSSLTNVYFEGNAPSVGQYAFAGDLLTFYCLPGTTGWDDFSANTGFPVKGSVLHLSLFSLDGTGDAF